MLEDEFVYLLSGEVVLITDDEEAFYPDVDVHVVTRDGQDYFTNKKGEPISTGYPSIT